MMKENLSAVYCIGAEDRTLDLFESQYSLPYGMSYNSYLIRDEKIAVLDTVDGRVTQAWQEKLLTALAGRRPDYLIISHMEPDHAANVRNLSDQYPEMRIVCSAKAAAMLNQFFDFDWSGRCQVVKEGDVLALGEHTLHFMMAPMVHWPEVMVTYEEKEKILFSADAFGKFGVTDAPEDWFNEARRYYFNICGKYGSPVQTLLKKVAALDIQAIYPLHGPVLKAPLEAYIHAYSLWSSYAPEEDGVFIAYASIYGHTAQAAKLLAEKLQDKGVKVSLCDLTRTEVSYAVGEAFRYSKMVLAASSYDAGIFPPMENFLSHLKSKTYQKRVVALMENGSWAPVSGKLMRSQLEAMKEVTICDPMVSIKSSLKEDSMAVLDLLAAHLLNQ